MNDETREPEAGAPTTSGTPDPGAVPDSDVPDEAFIDPDEPIVPSPRTDNVPEDALIRPTGEDASPISDDAFIDPDEPIVRTRPPSTPEDFESVVKGSQKEDVVVTGIGDDQHLEDLKRIERYGDPFVADLVQKVGYLADQLRSKGESGLRTEAGMTRFEASLRAYCTGYLTGKREGEGK